MALVTVFQIRTSRDKGRDWGPSLQGPCFASHPHGYHSVPFTFLPFAKCPLTLA